MCGEHDRWKQISVDPRSSDHDMTLPALHSGAGSCYRSTTGKRHCCLSTDICVTAQRHRQTDRQTRYSYIEALRWKRAASISEMSADIYWSRRTRFVVRAPRKAGYYRSRRRRRRLREINASCRLISYYRLVTGRRSDGLGLLAASLKRDRVGSLVLRSDRAPAPPSKTTTADMSWGWGLVFEVGVSLLR